MPVNTLSVICDTCTFTFFFFLTDNLINQGFKVIIFFSGRCLNYLIVSSVCESGKKVGIHSKIILHFIELWKECHMLLYTCCYYIGAKEI